jgi:hypothetical protein
LRCGELDDAVESFSAGSLQLSGKLLHSNEFEVRDPMAETHRLQNSCGGKLGIIGGLKPQPQRCRSSIVVPRETSLEMVRFEAAVPRGTLLGYGREPVTTISGTTNRSATQA